MSTLETDFKATLQSDVSEGWTAKAQEIVAHWFAKTAVVINVSQNFRLLVPADQRHALAEGVPPGFEVYVGRAEKHKTHLDFKQNWNPGGWLVPSSNVREAMDLAERCYRCAIRIDDLIGLVLYAPPNRWLEPATVFSRLWPLGSDRVFPRDVPAVKWSDDFLLSPKSSEILDAAIRAPE
jgi:hypothetical protein